MSVENFVYKYFVEPQYLSGAYNIYNTAVYGLILVAVLVPLYKFLKRLDVDLDEKFYLGMLPFIFLGVSIRVMTDVGYFPKLFIPIYRSIEFSPMVSPGTYFLVFVPALFSVVIAAYLKKYKKIEAYKTLLGLGVLTFASFNLYFYTIRQQGSVGWSPFAPVAVGFLSFTFIGAYYYFIENFKQYPICGYLKQKIPFVLVATHLYDASTTFVGIQFYGFWEKHVLPNFLIGLFGPFVMFALKLAVVPLVVYMLRDVEDKTERSLLYFAIFTLGIAPGTRNLLLTLLSA
ncbi:MAG: DUF63 family protein [archaeon]